MLRLLSLLQTHRYWPGTELADRLEVSARTVRREVDRLAEGVRRLETFVVHESAWTATARFADID